MKTLRIPNETEAATFGRNLGKSLKAGDILALTGDLGTGKTTLTKYIAEGMRIEEIITSPTFIILNEYTSGRIPLYHFDVYRINDPVEMLQLGYEEYFFGQGVTVIEWAEKIAELIPEDALAISMEYGEQEGERIYRCTF